MPKVKAAAATSGKKRFFLLSLLLLAVAAYVAARLRAGSKESQPVAREPGGLAFHLVWIWPQAAFEEQHLYALDSIFCSQPNARVVVYTNTLPAGLFGNLQAQGYALRVQPVDSDFLEAQKIDCAWLRHREQQKKSPFYDSYFADYLLAAILYRQGGVFFDFDSLLLRSLPAGQQFVTAAFVSLARGSEKLRSLAAAFFGQASSVFAQQPSSFRALLLSSLAVEGRQPAVFVASPAGSLSEAQVASLARSVFAGHAAMKMSCASESAISLLSSVLLRLKLTSGGKTLVGVPSRLEFAGRLAGVSPSLLPASVQLLAYRMPGLQLLPSEADCGKQPLRLSLLCSGDCHGFYAGDAASDDEALLSIANPLELCYASFKAARLGLSQVRLVRKAVASLLEDARKGTQLAFTLRLAEEPPATAACLLYDPSADTTAVINSASVAHTKRLIAGIHAAYPRMPVVVASAEPFAFGDCQPVEVVAAAASDSPAKRLNAALARVASEFTLVIADGAIALPSEPHFLEPLVAGLAAFDVVSASGVHGNFGRCSKAGRLSLRPSAAAVVQADGLAFAVADFVGDFALFKSFLLQELAGGWDAATFASAADLGFQEELFLRLAALPALSLKFAALPLLPAGQEQALPAGGSWAKFLQKAGCRQFSRFGVRLNKAEA